MQFTIETDRLLLRPLLETDSHAMFAMDSNPKVHLYLGNEPLTEIRQCDEYIKFIQQQYIDNGIGRFAVVVKDTNEVIGWAGLKFMTEPENGHIHFYDIGYRLAEAYWGRGYGYEAAKAWLDYGFGQMKLQKICATANVENAGSNRILQKIGLQQNGQYRHHDMLCNWYELENPTINNK